MKYRQITSGERYAIGALRRRGLSARAIAAELGRAHTTISHEISRNSCKDGGYRPFKASHRTRGRRSRSRRNARITPETWATVERYLRLDWSPEQIAGFLRAEGVLSISHETI
jgi:IS30 family transposase